MPYIGKQPTIGEFVELDALTASATDEYTLTRNSVAYYPETVNNLLVSINGVIQAGSTMSLSGNTLTVGATLSSSDVIDFVRVFGNVGNVVTPTDGSVTDVKIDSMSASKLTGALPAIDGSALTGLSNTPAFAAKRTGQQTANQGTATKVQFDTEIYDSDNKYDNTTDYRFTPTVAGVYVFHAQVSNNNLYNQAMLNIFLRKNGSTIMTGSVTGNNSTSNRDHTVNISMVDVANSTDYYEVWAEQQLANGSAIAEGNRCYFIGYKIA